MSIQSVTITKPTEPSFSTTEAINQLRVNLGFCGNNVKSILLTSSVPNEGKTFVTTNLWKAIAESGARVLLIDADMRNSVLRTTAGLRFDGEVYTLAHVLSGQVPLKDAIYKTNIPNAFLLPMSNYITNPSLLLENGVFGKVVGACESLFDYVLIDTPPVSVVSDALVMSKDVDGTVLVVRADETSNKLVTNSVNLLKRTGVPMLGFVLNRVNTGQHGRYYGGYNYSYGYGYGPDNDK